MFSSGGLSQALSVPHPTLPRRPALQFFRPLKGRQGTSGDTELRDLEAPESCLIGPKTAERYSANTEGRRQAGIQAFVLGVTG